MKGLILSGGHGTRLRPITYSQQKQLIPVANKPILFYAIEDIINAGVTDIGIIVGPNKEQVQEAVEKARFPAKINFIYQENPLGLAHAILISENFLKDSPFIMYLGDNLLKGGVKKFSQNFISQDADASILLTPVNDPTQFGVAELNGDGSVKRLVEKPKDPPSNLALCGIYFFKPPIFRAAKHIKPSFRGELEITDAIQWLIENEFKVHSDTVTGWWKDTGKPEDIIEANHLILDELKTSNEAELKNSAIRGRVKIGEGTVIDNSVVKGPVIIGKNCHIGPGTYIGPYTSIGNDCQITNGEIESSIIMNGVSICCGKKIIDSLIGNDAKISERNKLPRGHRFIIGDSSQVEI